MRRKAAAAALAALGGLAVAELALRAAGFSAPVLYRPDELRGHALAPAAHGQVGGEADNEVRINELGFHDRSRSIRRLPGRYRVAVLGDSFVEALQVPLEQNLCSVAERHLNEEPPRGWSGVEVLNFGVSGYGTAAADDTLLHDAAPFSPDLVVLCLFHNDWRENGWGLGSPGLGPRGRLVDGRLVIDRSFNELPAFQRRLRLDPLYRLAYRLRVVQLAKRLKDGLPRALEADERTARAQVDAAVARALALEDLARYAPMYEPVTAPEWREAWDVTERLIERTASDARSLGARFLLVRVGHPGEAVVPPPTADELKGLGITPSALDERLGRLAERNGFPFVSLAPAVARSSLRTGEPAHGRAGWGHYNASGHRAAGRALADGIRQVAAASPPSGTGRACGGSPRAENDAPLGSARQPVP